MIFEIVTGVIILLWVIRLWRNICAYIFLWYIKEYRFDRMLIHLRNTTQGKFILFPRFHIPPRSPKTFAMFGLLSVATVLVFFMLPSTLPIVFRIFIVDICMFPMSWVFVGLFWIPTHIVHSMRIRKASRLVSKKPFRMIIGITGSFGKTSVKMYVSHILEGAFHPLTTQSSINSAIGISERILKARNDTHDVFIAEMGAYKQGEIRNICSVVPPKIGILTAINAQHQDLFGTIQNTMSAKYELIASLPQNGIAIMNGDNEYVLELSKIAHKENKKVWLYTTKENKYPWCDTVFLIKNCVLEKDGISFALTVNNKNFVVQAPVFGIHQALNITAAIATGYAAGMTLRDAIFRIKTVTPVIKTLVKHVTSNGVTLIDDTFNNNPDAAKAGIEFLGQTGKKRKFLVFQPMIELGSYASSSHVMVGKIAGTLCDEIILTNSNFLTDFKKGVAQSKKKPTIHVFTPEKTALFITENARYGDCVLFKGKEAGLSFHRILHTKS